MNFLPKNEDGTEYKVPSSEGKYTKFQDGENHFRILSSATIGYEYWDENKKPVRNKIGWVKQPDNIRLNKDGSYTIKHFWAFVVFNYETSSIQIMEITQKTIMNAIKALVDNEKWGSPFDYDLTITKTGEGLETQYSIMPNPKTEVQKEIQDEYKENPVNLEALFENGDPFEASEQPKTQEQIDEDEEVLKAVEQL